jgi:hypothetical protein
LPLEEGPDLRFYSRAREKLLSGDFDSIDGSLKWREFRARLRVALVGRRVSLSLSVVPRRPGHRSTVYACTPIINAAASLYSTVQCMVSSLAGLLDVDIYFPRSIKKCNSFSITLY